MRAGRCRFVLSGTGTAAAASWRVGNAPSEFVRHFGGGVVRRFFFDTRTGNKHKVGQWKEGEKQRCRGLDPLRKKTTKAHGARKVRS